MADGDDPPLVKVRLHADGEDVETPWAIDLGPAGDHGARKLQLDNVPFLHAKPTYGDVIIATPDQDGYLEWDSGGVPYEQIFERIHEDRGRWAMIVDYFPEPNADLDAEFRTLCRWADAHDLVTEGAWGVREGRPGRLYLAVPGGSTVEGVMKMLAESGARLTLTLEHPRDDDE